MSQSPQVSDIMTRAREAGSKRAEEVWTADSWRKAPAQCPDLRALIAEQAGAPGAAMTLMDAWTAGYRATSAEHEKKALAALI